MHNVQCKLYIAFIHIDTQILLNVNVEFKCFYYCTVSQLTYIPNP